MTRRKVVKPVSKKSDRLKKYILTVVQAALGALIVVWFFLYSVTASMTINSNKDEYSYVADFSELNSDYYSSKSYVQNFENAINDIVRFIAIREEFETNGSYDKDKIIYVGQYANRFISEPYEGPDAGYYLDDIVKWGQKKVSHDYKFFFSWEEYNKFFGLPLMTPHFDEDEIVVSTEEEIDVEVDINDEIENDLTKENQNEIVAYLDTVNNSFLSAEGKTIESYVDNGEDYTKLAACLENTVDSILAYYHDYIELQEKYQEDTSNVRYCIITKDDNKNIIYTNVSTINKGASIGKIEAIMKGFGEYVYASPATVNFLSNTSITYDVIKNAVNNYSYAYGDDTKIWISIDNKFPVDDAFKKNEIAHVKSARMIPWMVSLGALSFIGFIAIGAWLIISEKKKYSYPDAKNDLKDFDRLPIEVSALFFILLILVLIIGESIIYKNYKSAVALDTVFYIIPISLLLGIDIFIALLFLYGFIRRIICKNLLDGSLLSLIIPVFSGWYDKLSKWFDSFYDESGVPIRVFASYVLFVITNVLFVSFIFFSNYTILSLCGLVLIDLIVGIVYFKRNWERKEIVDALKRINSGERDVIIDLANIHGTNKVLAKEINYVGIGITKAVETSIKDEKLKADLITNVSHDIKTPLTSIINYVSLLKRENIENENAKKYIRVLEEKSQRLQQLTIDLVEASKISSGNIILEYANINFAELLAQTVGEFEEKFEERGLSVVLNLSSKSIIISVDPRRIWRVVENLFNNIYKYALENTRVYVDLIETNDDDGKWMHVSIKNISKHELNIQADELTERFIRGDVSRSTEGSGLGLSIAKSLTTVQGGKFDIYLDGDLFKVTLSFPVVENE